MEANVYQIDGKVAKKISLPEVFAKAYNEDLVKRALLAEQSSEYQPQGHYKLAGMDTSASYTGRYGTYRTQRHTGRPPRPRQRFAKGGGGAVRKIPYSVKGRRAHPHNPDKIILERINRKEYAKALEMAIGAMSNASLIKRTHVFNEPLPIVVSSEIEKVAKAKELMKIFAALGLNEDIAKSHYPRSAIESRRRSKKRHFRNSVLLVAKDPKIVGRAGRNIPGVDVLSVDRMRVGKLAPGARPRLSVWSEAAAMSVTEGVAHSVKNYKQ